MEVLLSSCYGPSFVYFSGVLSELFDLLFTLLLAYYYREGHGAAVVILKISHGFEQSLLAVALHPDGIMPGQRCSNTPPRPVVGKLFKPRATYKIFNPAAGQRPIFENKTVTIKP